MVFCEALVSRGLSCVVGDGRGADGLTVGSWYVLMMGWEMMILNSESCLTGHDEAACVARLQGIEYV